MPKVHHGNIFEYKARVTDLEDEVSVLKKRLEGLRKAKNQTYIRREKTYCRVLPLRKEEPPSSPPLPPSNTKFSPRPEPEENHHHRREIEELHERIARLTDDLALAEQKYQEEARGMRETIYRLQTDLSSLRRSHRHELERLSAEHTTTLEKLRREHTEELALYLENSERDRAARDDMERQVEEARVKYKLAQHTDVEGMKSEIERLRKSYDNLQHLHRTEVERLEGQISEFQQSQGKFPRQRQYQLIPDRSYIVRRTPPYPSRNTEPEKVHVANGPTRPDTSPGLVFSRSPKLLKPEEESKAVSRPRSCNQRSKSPNKVPEVPVRPKSCATAKNCKPPRGISTSTANSCGNHRPSLPSRPPTAYLRATPKVDTGLGTLAKPPGGSLLEVYPGTLFHSRYKRTFAKAVS